MFERISSCLDCVAENLPLTIARFLADINLNYECCCCSSQDARASNLQQLLVTNSYNNVCTCSFRTGYSWVFAVLSKILPPNVDGSTKRVWLSMWWETRQQLLDDEFSKILFLCITASLVATPNDESLMSFPDWYLILDENFAIFPDFMQKSVQLLKNKITLEIINSYRIDNEPLSLKQPKGVLACLVSQKVTTRMVPAFYEVLESSSDDSESFFCRRLLYDLNPVVEDEIPRLTAHLNTILHSNVAALEDFCLYRLPDSLVHIFLGKVVEEFLDGRIKSNDVFKGIIILFERSNINDKQEYLEKFVHRLLDSLPNLIPFTSYTQQSIRILILIEELITKYELDLLCKLFFSMIELMFDGIPQNGTILLIQSLTRMFGKNSSLINPLIRLTTIQIVTRIVVGSYSLCSSTIFYQDVLSSDRLKESIEMLVDANTEISLDCDNSSIFEAQNDLLTHWLEMNCYFITQNKSSDSSSSITRKFLCFRGKTKKARDATAPASLSGKRPAMVSWLSDKIITKCFERRTMSFMRFSGMLGHHTKSILTGLLGHAPKDDDCNILLTIEAALQRHAISSLVDDVLTKGSKSVYFSILGLISNEEIISSFFDVILQSDDTNKPPIGQIFRGIRRLLRPSNTFISVHLPKILTIIRRSTQSIDHCGLFSSSSAMLYLLMNFISCLPDVTFVARLELYFCTVHGFLNLPIFCSSSVIRGDGTDPSCGGETPNSVPLALFFLCRAKSSSKVCDNGWLANVNKFNSHKMFEQWVNSTDSRSSLETPSSPIIIALSTQTLTTHCLTHFTENTTREILNFRRNIGDLWRDRISQVDPTLNSSYITPPTCELAMRMDSINRNDDIQFLGATFISLSYHTILSDNGLTLQDSEETDSSGKVFYHLFRRVSKKMSDVICEETAECSERSLLMLFVHWGLEIEEFSRRIATKFSDCSFLSFLEIALYGNIRKSNFQCIWNGLRLAACLPEVKAMQWFLKDHTPLLFHEFSGIRVFLLRIISNFYSFNTRRHPRILSENRPYVAPTLFLAAFALRWNITATTEGKKQRESAFNWDEGSLEQDDINVSSKTNEETVVDMLWGRNSSPPMVMDHHSDPKLRRSASIKKKTKKVRSPEISQKQIQDTIRSNALKWILNLFTSRPTFPVDSISINVSSYPLAESSEESVLLVTSMFDLLRSIDIMKKQHAGSKNTNTLVVAASLLLLSETTRLCAWHGLSMKTLKTSVELRIIHNLIKQKPYIEIEKRGELPIKSSTGKSGKKRPSVLIKRKKKRYKNSWKSFLLTIWRFSPLIIANLVHRYPNKRTSIRRFLINIVGREPHLIVTLQIVYCNSDISNILNVILTPKNNYYHHNKYPITGYSCSCLVPNGVRETNIQSSNTNSILRRIPSLPWQYFNLKSEGISHSDLLLNLLANYNKYSNLIKRFVLCRILDALPSKDLEILLIEITQCLLNDKEGFILWFVVAACMRSPVFQDLFLFQVSTLPQTDNVLLLTSHILPLGHTIINRIDPRRSPSIISQFNYLASLIDLSAQIFYVSPISLRESILIQSLEKINKQKDHAIYLPSDPTYEILEIIPSEAKLMQSAAKSPYLATFRVTRSPKTQNEGCNRDLSNVMNTALPSAAAAASLPNHPMETSSRKSLIFKMNDDIRQDQLVIQFMQIFSEIFEPLNLNLKLFPYRVIPYRKNKVHGGIIEVIENAPSRHQIGKTNSCNLLEYFNKKYTTIEEFEVARWNFTQSLAAYSVLCFVLQVKDRHNGNLLITDLGHIIHIDFGFIFDISPGRDLQFEKAPFKLTNDMVCLLGGHISAKPFKAFQQLVIRGYLAVRDKGELLVCLASMMADSLPCFKNRSIARLRQRLQLDYDDVQAANFMKDQIMLAYSSLSTVLYDLVQSIQQGIAR